MTGGTDQKTADEQFDARIATETRQASFIGGLALIAAIVYGYWPKPFVLASLILLGFTWLAAYLATLLLQNLKAVTAIRQDMTITRILDKSDRRQAREAKAAEDAVGSGKP